MVGFIFVKEQKTIDFSPLYDILYMVYDGQTFFPHHMIHKTVKSRKTIMSKCRHCNIEITDDTQVCPLCRCVVEVDEHTDNRYPDIRFRHPETASCSPYIFICSNLLEVLFVYHEL